jgi:hypothetical protein
MTTLIRAEKVERVLHPTDTLGLSKSSADEREVAMRKQFIKAGRYLISRGFNLNKLLKQVMA